MSDATTLASCFAVAMSCGTLYVYSAYAPQLSERLGFSATLISNIGMVGNLAMSGTGPLAGWVTDRYGFTAPIVTSWVSTFVGYYLVRTMYLNALSSPSLLALALFLVGVGSTFAFSAAVKCAAVNFPASRGFATAMPMAGYGLAAFTISSLSNWLVPGDTLGFLSVLCFVPAALIVLFGPIVVMSQPKAHKKPKEYDDDYIGLVSLDHASRAAQAAAQTRAKREIHGAALFRSPLYWAYSALLGLLAAMGQAYIYNCGYIVKALAMTEEHEWQAKQVAILSVANFSGRILAGVISDVLKIHLRKSRTNTILVSVVLCFAAQIACMNVKTVQALWLPSTLSGLFYGYCYGGFPGVVGDAFGVSHFSSNWGIVALSPVPVSYILSVRMGHTYDAHAHDGICVGTQCFKDAFKLHAYLACAAFLLAVFIIRRLER